MWISQRSHSESCWKRSFVLLGIFGVGVVFFLLLLFLSHPVMLMANHCSGEGGTSCIFARGFEKCSVAWKGSLRNCSGTCCWCVESATRTAGWWEQVGALWKPKIKTGKQGATASQGGRNGARQTFESVSAAETSPGPFMPLAVGTDTTCNIRL